MFDFDFDFVFDCKRADQGFFMVFLGSRANAELVTKFHNALHASHPALPIVT
jgi:hypothetical protein